MPWSDQGGGNGSGPWGSRGPGGPQPPNLEDILRDGQNKFRSFLPGGGRGWRSLLLIFMIAVGAWLASGFYKVNTDEQGVVLRFGEWVRTTPPGLHYHLPSPIETVLTPAVTRVNKTEVGFRSPPQSGRGGSARQVPEEALMLTGDENIVDINFTVLWAIKDAGEFLFNIRNPEQTVKSVAESAMRDTIGRDNLEQILTKGRGEIETLSLELIQHILDEYGAGIQIRQVKLEKVDPPEQVIDSFRDVQAAKADQETLQNQARAYRNDIVPRARGEAEKITQGGEAYKQEVVARATGDAKRFISVLDAYLKSKDVTQRRIYLETLEAVLGNIDKVIIDKSAGGGTGVVPYLPLPEVQKRSTRAPRTTAPSGSTGSQGDVR